MAIMGGDLILNSIGLILLIFFCILGFIFTFNRKYLKTALVAFVTLVLLIISYFILYYLILQLYH